MMVKLDQVAANGAPAAEASPSRGPGERSAAPAPAASPAQPEATVSLSQAAREMRLAQEAVAAAPEVRSEKVAEISRAVAEGSYRVQPEAVAEKMLAQALEETV